MPKTIVCLMSFAAACSLLVGCGGAKKDLGLPQLQVRQPLNGSMVSSSSVTLDGVTDQATVLVNGKWVAATAGKLHFDQPLDPGRNIIDVSAGNLAGTTTVRLEVIRQ